MKGKRKTTVKKVKADKSTEEAKRKPGRKPGPPTRPIDFAMEQELFDAFDAHISNPEIFPFKPEITPALNLLLRKFFKAEGILK